MEIESHGLQENEYDRCHKLNTYYQIIFKVQITNKVIQKAPSQIGMSSISSHATRVKLPSQVK